MDLMLLLLLGRRGGTRRLPSRERGVGSRFQAAGRAIEGSVEVGKDIETHGDKAGN